VFFNEGDENFPAEIAASYPLTSDYADSRMNPLHQRVVEDS
jgi:hypothetical protein